MFLAAPINRPLVVGEIVGAQSTVDDNYYRGKILKQIDHSTYLINFIDFGDIDSVPISKIFELTQEFMVMSYIIIEFFSVYNNNI